MSEVHETHDYDPRYARAQTIDGAKARYVYQEGYTLTNLESDVRRILKEGEPEYTWNDLTEPETMYF